MRSKTQSKTCSSETSWHSPCWRRCRRSPRSQRSQATTTDGHGTVTVTSRDSSGGPSCRPRRSPTDRRRAPPSRRRTGSRSRARRSRSRASRRSSTAAGPARSWRCPTTATAPRPPRATSSSAPTTSVPTYKTASGGSGAVQVGRVHRVPRSVRRDRLPDRQRRRRTDRLLTGGDIDPESLQRGRDGDLWVGDEFGPWILHFDSKGRLLDPPFPMPGGLQSPNNPSLGGQTGDPTQQPRARGHGDLAERQVPVRRRSRVQRSPTPTSCAGTSSSSASRTRRSPAARGSTTSRTPPTSWPTWRPSTEHHLVLIERDGGRGLTALFRNVYEIDLRDVDAAGFVEKEVVVDLTKIPDPNLVSLPEIHPGDLGLGDPFWVMCESVEAIHPVGDDRIMIGCDNNLPNTGRNPASPTTTSSSSSTCQDSTDTPPIGCGTTVRVHHPPNCLLAHRASTCVSGQRADRGTGLVADVGAWARGSSVHGNRCGSRHVEVPWGDQSHTTHPSIGQTVGAARAASEPSRSASVIAIVFTACAGEATATTRRASMRQRRRRQRDVGDELVGAATENTEAPADAGRPVDQASVRSAAPTSPAPTSPRLGRDIAIEMHVTMTSEDLRRTVQGIMRVGVGARRRGVRLRHRLRRRGWQRPPTRRHRPAGRR